MNEISNQPTDREEIRTPTNSLLPFAAASGITLVLLGLVTSWLLFGLGVIVTVVSLVGWMRSTRASISELPSDQA